MQISSGLHPSTFKNNAKNGDTLATWSCLANECPKLGKGTFHTMSPKHLDRYVTEFAGRHNIREADTVDQMGIIAVGMIGKRLRYDELIQDNGLDSTARPTAG